MKQESLFEEKIVSFSKVTPTRTFEGIAKQIEEAILNGELKPDDRLPSERDLQKVFGVGRASVREAVRILENNGLIEVRTGSINGGIYVKHLSPSYTVDSLQRLFLTEQINIKELIEYRVELEGVTVSWAAQRATQEDISNIEDIIAKMKVESNRTRFNNDDLQFHIIIAQAAKNRISTLVMRAIRQTLLRVMQETFANDMDERKISNIIQEHRAILGAIKERDSGKAQLAMREHITNSYLMTEPK